MLREFNPVWNLDSAFPGGSTSPELVAELGELEQCFLALHKEFAVLSENPNQLAVLLQESQRVIARLYTCFGFVGCLTAADTEDKQALAHMGRLHLLQAQMNDLLVLLGKNLSQMSDTAWQDFCALPETQVLLFNLEELRQQAKELLPLDQEMLINALSVNGFHDWGALYDRLVAQIKIASSDASGKVEQLSAGQALNRLSDADPTVRNDLLTSWEQAWQTQSDVGAVELNALAGYRLAVYKSRRWPSFMKEPLQMNRMSADTLDSMWATISANKTKLVNYLRRKRELLGVEKLSWADFGAPVVLTGSSKTFTFSEAAEFVIDQFGRFSPKMSAYAEEALLKRWVEAENRPHKGIGAFCTAFVSLNEERVFMTFDGSLGGIGTLAHELGHAFHSRSMQGLPILACNIGMAVAETASTFAEIVVANASLSQAQNDAHKIELLEDKINRAASMMMNIHARFIFETNFYKIREKRQVSAEELSEIMLAAQKEAYADALDIWHPTFWLSKGHFHGTGIPFYNFPYTFGFLFSNGIYAQAQNAGADFEDRYIELLRNTGCMTVEDLARRFLNADLTQAPFWQAAIDSALEDYEEYMALSEAYLEAKK